MVLKLSLDLRKRSIFTVKSINTIKTFSEISEIILHRTFQTDKAVLRIIILSLAELFIIQ